MIANAVFSPIFQRTQHGDRIHQAVAGQVGMGADDIRIGQENALLVGRCPVMHHVAGRGGGTAVELIVRQHGPAVVVSSISFGGGVGKDVMAT